MMKKLLPAIALAAALLSTPALADFSYRDGNGVLRTMKSLTCCTPTSPPGSLPFIQPQATIVDVENNPLGTNSNPLVTAPTAGTVSIAPVRTSAPAASLVVKAVPASFYGFQVGADSTLAAAPWWIMVFDSTTVPVDGAVTPAFCYPIPSGGTLGSFSFGDVPAAFSVGIVVAVSTAGCFTKAASAHAFISAVAR